MQKGLWLCLKAAVIFVLALLLLIPLWMIGNTISERAQRRTQVEDEIARTYSGEQTLAGPVLVLPYTITRVVTQEVDGKKQSRTEVERQAVHVLPGRLHIDGKVGVSTRHRGSDIFEVLVYGSDLNLQGHFDVPDHGNIHAAANERIDWGTPYVAVGVQDNRGIQNAPELIINNTRHLFAPGNPLTVLGAGIHANLPNATLAGGHFNFGIKLKLLGTSRLGWIPMGEDTRVHLQGNWAYPSFVGRALPQSHQEGPQRFEAEWQTSHYATNMPQLFEAAVKAGDERLLQQHVSINFVQPVDVYQQSERSVKYGFLFVLLTFSAFALFEVLKKLPIHPVQYGLVGFAQALFFLLLIALSEHINFAYAYASASVACVGLISFYLCHVLHSLRRGLAFGALLGVLYGVLYGVLVSEGNALLMGSLLLFLLLAGVMLLTRKLNWYALGADNASETSR